MARHHLTFRNIRPAVVAAADQVFAAKPWRMTDHNEQMQVAAQFVDAVCRSYQIPTAAVVIGSEGNGLMPALVDDDGSPLSPAAIVMDHFSITTLFYLTRVHVLSNDGAMAVNETDPLGWACSLFYTVKPAMFRARAREGRITDVTARDTYSQESWDYLCDNNLAVGDSLVVSRQEAAEALAERQQGEQQSDNDSVPDEQEIDDVPEASSLNRDALRSLAAVREIPGRGRMTRNQLVDALRECGAVR